MLIVLDPEAEAEVENAATWYHEQSPGLELRFLRALEDALATIKRSPLAFQKVIEDIRQFRIGSFPFIVLYAVRIDVIVVLSVFHTSRDPSHKPVR